jgi:hypothetical protein
LLLPAKWGKRTLVYFGATNYKAEAKAAAKTWNASGVRFR